MMISSYFLFLLLVFFEGYPTSGPTLVWAEEFNYQGLPDSTVWSYDSGDGCPRLCGWGNREVQYYTVKDPANARVENGKLIIEAHKKNGRWTSARLKTQGKKHFQYGHLKIRARLPEGSGTWPALWMLGADIGKVGWPASGEIDIMEHAGKIPGRVLGTLHSPASYGDSEHSGKVIVKDHTTAFHEYEVQWTESAITFLLDGKAFYTYQPKEKTKENWPFSKDFFILINLAMGGNFGSDPQFESQGKKDGIDPALTTARLEVDYIRVYQ